MKLAGTVILYNPEREVIDNIQTYLPFLDKLYVMDNSTKKIEFLDEIKAFNKVEYISLGGNKGIALALKVATERAIEDGYDMIMSMDQDSKYPTEDFKYIKDYINTKDLSDVGIIAINFTGNIYDRISDDKSYTEEIDSSISSGMIILLDKHKNTEGYDERLFIDLVDYDISIKMKIAGYKIIFFRNIILNHKLGETRTMKFLFITKHPKIHAPIRYYYMYRNYTYLTKFKKGLWKEILNTKNNRRLMKLSYKIKCIITAKHPLLAWRMIRQGIHDGKKGILGSYEDRKMVAK